MVVIRGRLPQEIAALLEKALKAAMDALKQEGNDDSGESAERSAPTGAKGFPFSRE